jgi:hypothetical protein
VTTIWKYALEITDRQVVEVPEGAEVLAVQEQAGKVCLWMMVDPEAKKEKRTFVIVGTGHPIEGASYLDYYGTAQVGPMVWHVFEAML